MKTNNLYEITYLLASDQNEKDAMEIQSRIENFIQKEGGIITGTSYLDHSEASMDSLGLQKIPAKRKLTYPIKGHLFGYFLSTVFQAKSSLINTLKQEIKNEFEPILRFVTLKINPAKINQKQSGKIQSLANSQIQTIAKSEENAVMEKPEKVLQNKDEETIDETKTKTRQPKEKIAIDTETLNKKLDEILEDQF